MKADNNWPVLDKPRPVMSLEVQCEIATQLAIGCGLLTPAIILGIVLVVNSAGVTNFVVPKEWACSPEWGCWLLVAALSGVGSGFVTEMVSRIVLRRLFATEKPTSE